VHSHICQWLVLEYTRRAQGDDFDLTGETPCGLPAVAHIDWGDGVLYWYCAEHFDMRISFIRKCGRTEVLKASGVK
jgi:hypothetical protein